MVKRRKEEDIAGVIEFEGRSADDPEFASWLAEHRARKGGKVRVSSRRDRCPCHVHPGGRHGVVAGEIRESVEIARSRR